jgi:hypothetical protein
VHGRRGQAQRDRLERGDSPAPDDAAGGRGEFGLRELGSVEYGPGVASEDERGVGEANPPSRPLEQRDAGLAFEYCELLGDRGGRELQRIGNGGNGPALVQLVE